MKTETGTLFSVLTFGFKTYRKSEKTTINAAIVAADRDKRIILWISLFFGFLEETLLWIAIILLVSLLMNELEHALIQPVVPDSVPFFFSSYELEAFTFEKPDTFSIICRNICE